MNFSHSPENTETIRPPRRPSAPPGSPATGRRWAAWSVCIVLAGLVAPVRLIGARPTVAVAQRGPTAVPAATATPTPDPAPGMCQLSGSETADTAKIEQGETVGLQLVLFAQCPESLRGRADILLVMDRSASMADLGKYEAARTAVRQFVQNVDYTRHRVGLVPFNSSAYVAQPLTTDRDRMLRALDSLGSPDGGTNIGAAITVGDNELKYSGRREAVGILVLLTDGQSSYDAMFTAADEAKRRGVVIFTVGLGVDAAQNALRRVASSSDYYYFAPSAADLAEIYDKIAHVIRDFTVTDLTIHDDLAPGVVYAGDSGLPDQPAGSTALTWWRAFLPATGITLTYRVQINRAGRVRPSAPAWAEFTDGDLSRRKFTFVPPEIEVTPKVIRYAYLPQLWRNQCLPATSWADVVLAIDNSASMGDQGKLGKAVAAARSFVALLHPEGDQAAVLTFNSVARLVQPLTGERALLDGALTGLDTGNGTRIDLGISKAVEELTSPRHKPKNRAVLVLLTDGRHSGPPAAVPTEARNARQQGITVFTIALGSDADRDLLREVAGSPARAFYAPDVADLERIYAQVAGLVGCQ